MHTPEHGIEGLMDSETKLAEVHKHPFGIIILYIQVTLGLLVAIALIAFLVPSFLTDQEQRNQAAQIIGVGTVIVSAIVLFFLLLATYIYSQNRLIITDKNVTQVLQKGLLSRQISELSLANVEDVTSEQTGIFSTLFDYGELRIETAGEQNNFHYTYCPRANYYGRLVLDARNHYVESDPVRAERANSQLNTPRS